MVWAILIPLLVIGVAAAVVPVMLGMLHDHRAKRSGSSRYLHRFSQPRRMERDPETRDPVRLPATTSAAVAMDAMREEGVSEVLVEGADGHTGVVKDHEVRGRLAEDVPAQNVPLGSLSDEVRSADAG